MWADPSNFQIKVFNAGTPADTGGVFTDAKDGIVEPVVGEAAIELASELGFPERSENRSGTSIMIVDFETGGEDSRIDR